MAIWHESARGRSYAQIRVPAAPDTCPSASAAGRQWQAVLQRLVFEIMSRSGPAPPALAIGTRCCGCGDGHTLLWIWHAALQVAHVEGGAGRSGKGEEQM